MSQAHGSTSETSTEGFGLEATLESEAGGPVGVFRHDGAGPTPATIPGPETDSSVAGRRTAAVISPWPEADRLAGRRTAARRPSLSTSQVLLAYYKEKDVFFSTDGVLMLISIALCVCVAVLQLGGGVGCAGGGLGGALAVGGTALAAAAALVALLAARALNLHLAAPSLCLLLIVTWCSVSGALLLVSAALRLVTCRPLALIDYLSASLALCASGLLCASATLTHTAAMRAYDAARARTAVTPRNHTQEQHV